MKKTCRNFFFYGLIALWLFFNLGGGLLIKYSALYHDRIWMLAFFFVMLMGTFGARAVVSVILGQYYQLSYVYPFLGLNYVLSMIAGILLFQEKFDCLRLAGSLVIVLGVFLLMFSKNKEEGRA